MAIAAVKNGKHVLCEKPLALNLKQSEAMFAAAKKAKIVHMVCHNYRRIPAIALAKRMIGEGALGRIYHFRARYAQDRLADPEFPLDWRLQKETSGSGVHSDINSHIIDLGRYLVGEFEEVCGLLNTFIPERPLRGFAGQGHAQDGQGDRAGFRDVHRVDGKRRDGEPGSHALRARPEQPHRDRNQRQQRLDLF